MQNLAAPLLACAHAGLGVLSLVAVTDTGGPAHVPDLLAVVGPAAARLEDLLVALAEDCASAVAVMVADEPDA